MMSKQKISVVGGGAVGKAVAAYYDGVKIYDKYKDSDSIEEVCGADYIFVAVPTPFKSTDGHRSEPQTPTDKIRGNPRSQSEEIRGHNPRKSAGPAGQDLTEMDDAVDNITSHLTRPEEQIIIIKSTVVPGTTDNYQENYPRVNFVFSPEFLTESVAVEDFAHPDKQIVGFTKKTRDLADKVMTVLPNAPFKKTMPAKEAEMVKYTINTYYAFKVIFGNAIYDFCEKVGADYEQVREGLTADSRIIDSHFDVWHGGFRGYGGKCLPKDVRTLIWLAKQSGVDIRFLEQIREINERLLELDQKNI